MKPGSLPRIPSPLFPIETFESHASGKQCSDSTHPWGIRPIGPRGPGGAGPLIVFLQPPEGHGAGLVVDPGLPGDLSPAHPLGRVQKSPADGEAAGAAKT